nr:unnamed protein product [Callosobruchus chinensis]
MIAGLLCHAAGQLRVLKYALMNLDENPNPDLTSESPEMDGKNTDEDEDLYLRISQCVQHYDDIFEFVRRIEHTYSFVVFSQFLASTIVICISCLQMSKENMMSVAFLTSTVFAIAMLNELFVFCYHGTVLYEEVSMDINMDWMLSGEAQMFVRFVFKQRQPDSLRVY